MEKAGIRNNLYSLDFGKGQKQKIRKVEARDLNLDPRIQSFNRKITSQIGLITVERAKHFNPGGQW